MLHAASYRDSNTAVNIVARCKWLKLQCLQDTVVHDNCFNNSFSLAEQFEGKGIDKSSPLYIASSWKEASPEIVRKVMQVH